VREHPAYRSDSVVTEEIAYDLMQTCRAIGEGKLACPELLGSATIESGEAVFFMSIDELQSLAYLVDPEDAYERQLVGRLAPTDKAKLIQKFFHQPKTLTRLGSFSKTLPRKSSTRNIGPVPIAEAKT
jgi:hypothetical protein